MVKHPLSQPQDPLPKVREIGRRVVGIDKEAVARSTSGHYCYEFEFAQEYGAEDTTSM